MIKLSNMTFGYNKIELLFKNMNLELASGGICGLLGKNGAGKTTLLKILSGLLFPTSGECRVLQSDAAKRKPEVLRDIYVVPEELFVPLLTAENYVKLYAPLYPKFENTLFNQCADEFNFPRNKVLTTLSYGQKKKFLISFAIATRCKVIIFDEPTNGLDIPSKSQFRKVIAANVNDERLFIISTHQVHDVENLIDRIVILDEGNIIMNATLTTISNKLAFEQQSTEPESDSCFYYEKRLGGYAAVKANKANLETNVDLELLFNAVLLNTNKIKKLFGETNNE